MRHVPKRKSGRFLVFFAAFLLFFIAGSSFYPGTDRCLARDNWSLDWEATREGYRSIAVSPRGKVVATANKDITLWNADGDPIRNITPEGNSDPITDLAFGPKGKYLAAVSLAKKIWVYAVGDGELIDSTRDESMFSIVGLKQDFKFQYSLAFSPDREEVAMGTKADNLIIWEIGSYGDHKSYFPGKGTQMYSITAVDYGPTGELLAAGGAFSNNPADVRVWERGTEKKVCDLNGHDGPIWAVEFSPNGKYLATASEDGYVRVWEARSGKLIETLFEGNSPVKSLAWDNPGGVLAAATEAGKVSFWRVSGAAEADGAVSRSAGGEQFQEIRTMNFGSGGIASLAWSKSGNFYAGGADTGLRAWKTNIRPPVSVDFRTFPSTPSTGETVEFSPDLSDFQGDVESWRWEFGDGEVSRRNNPSHEYGDDGNYEVRLTVTGSGGRNATSSHSIQVKNRPPEVQVDLEGGYQAGERVQLDACRSRDPDGRIVQFSWDLDGDGITEETTEDCSLRHRFPEEGIYDLKVEALDDDRARSEVGESLNIAAENQLPTANFEIISSTQDLIPGKEIRLDASGSFDPDGKIEKFVWQLGDGSEKTGEEVSYSYDESGDYKVTLTVSDGEGGRDKVFQNVSVASGQPPVARVQVSPEEVAPDESFTVDACGSTDPDGEIEEYRWDFDGDGEYEETGSSCEIEHSFAEGGSQSIEVKVVDQTGQADSFSAGLAVMTEKAPVVDFDWKAREPKTGEKIDFSVEAEDPDGKVVSFSWSFGDGSESSIKDPQHQYEDDGQYEVSLLVEDEDGNSEEVKKELTVKNRAPELNFRVKPDRISVGEKVELNGCKSSDPDGQIASYFWDFDGDGEPEESTDDCRIEHVFEEPGEVEPRLKVVDDDGRAQDVKLKVRIRKVDIGFEFEPKNPVEGEEVSFKPDLGNLKTEPKSWHWYFGEKAESNDMKPSYTFEDSGEREVRLVIEGEGGSKFEASETISVSAGQPPKVDFTYEEVGPKSDGVFRFTAQVNPEDRDEIKEFKWDFDGDGEFDASGKEVKREIKFDGSGKVRLKVLDEDGQSSTATKKIVSGGAPGEKYAVVIGINDYKNFPDSERADVNCAVTTCDLEFAEKDAKDFKNLITGSQIEGFPRENVFILTGEEATEPNILSKLDKVNRLADENDLVVFFFSGHGARGERNENLEGEPDNRDEYFVTYETDLDQLQGTSLRDDDFARKVNSLESSFVGFLDSCHSGGLRKGVNDGSKGGKGGRSLFDESLAEGGKKVVIASSTESTESYSSGQLRNGFFTYTLLNALKGKADYNGDDSITVPEVFKYVKRNLEKSTPVMIPGDAGNKGVLVKTKSLVVDFNYKPTENLSTFKEVNFNFDKVKPNTKGSEEVVQDVKWYFGDGSTSTELNPTYQYKNDGKYTVKLVVTGKSGEESEVTRTVKVNNRAPNLDLLVEPGEPKAGDRVKLNACMSYDKDGFIEKYHWDVDGDGEFEKDTGGCRLDHKFSEVDRHDITVRATDDDGATSEVSEAVEVTSANSPPEAEFSIDPREPEAGKVVTFSAASSHDSDGEIVQYMWDFDGDGDFERKSSEDKTSFSFGKVGEYQIGLKVVDDDDSVASTEKRVKVERRNVAPKVDFSFKPKNPTEFDRIKFIPDAEDPDGEIVSYQWSFGDGDEASARSPKHLYESEGEHLVRLEVKDDRGKTSAVEKEISVRRVIIGRVAGVVEGWNEAGLGDKLVIDLTRDDGLNKGDELEVYRVINYSEDEVARIFRGVIKVQGFISGKDQTVCKVVELNGSEPIKVGNAVKYEP